MLVLLRSQDLLRLVMVRVALRALAHIPAKHTSGTYEHHGSEVEEDRLNNGTPLHRTLGPESVQIARAGVHGCRR